MHIDIQKKLYQKTHLAEDGITQIVGEEEHIMYSLKIMEDYFTEDGEEAVKEMISDLKEIAKELEEENKIMEFQETQFKNYIEELKKYDYRNIKINKEDEIKSPQFTKEQLNLMNFGIVLYKSFDKLFNNDVVSKSVIKEKIEELKEEYKKLENSSDFIIADDIQPKIQVLEELLEDK